MMTSELKNKFQIDACASMRELMTQVTSAPTLVHMTAPPSKWTYCNPHHEMNGVLLKFVSILWNRTSVEVVDKFSSTSIDFIRSERELENMHLYGV